MAKLFQNTEDFQTALPHVHQGAEDILVYAEDSDEQFIIPFVGQAYFDEIAEKLAENEFDLTDDETIDPIEKKVIKQLRRASAYYAVFSAMPHLNLQISNLGSRSPSNSDSTPLRQWEFNLGRHEAVVKADFFLDKALKTMEESPDIFTTWIESDEYVAFKDQMLTTAEDFRKKGLINISDSRRLFMKLVPFMTKVVEQHIIPCIGAELYEGLKEKLVDQEALSAKESVLMKYLLPALAHLSMYRASAELVLEVSDQGIRLVSSMDGQQSRSHSQQNYEMWRREVLGDGQNYMSRTKKYLDDNAADFPDYENSEASGNQTPDYRIPDNDSQSSIYF